MITAIVLIKAEPKSITGAATRIAGIEGVSQVYSVSGEWDLVAILEVTDYEAVASIVTEKMAPRPRATAYTNVDGFPGILQKGFGAGLGHRAGITG